MKSCLFLGFLSLAILLGGCDKPNQFLEKVPPPARIEKQNPLQSPEAQNSISGHVIDSITNEILIDARIEIVNAASQALIGWARTDAQGNYSISDLIAGRYLVRVGMSGYDTFASSPKNLSGGIHLAQDVALNQILNTVSGRITDAVSGAGVEGAQVQLRNSLSDAIVKTVTSDRRGVYALPSLPAGNYKLLVTKSGYDDFPSSRPGLIKGGMTSNVDFVLDPKKLTISGRAFDSETQASLAGVEIRVINQNGSTAASVITGADGKYSISSLYTGTYSLSATLAGYRQFLTTAPGIAIGGNAYIVDVAMAATKNTVYGFVGNALNGAGIAGARVQLINATTGVVFSAVDTSSNGQYRMEIVPSGKYTMIFSHAGYTEYTTIQPGVLGNGQIVRVDASLSPTLVSGQFRIVLTWTAAKSGAVRDVDSYLLIPNFVSPIYYGRKTFEGAGANLDRDDTDWQGPETITIDRSYSGVYHYYIVNYSDTGNLTALGNSNVIVTVYGGSGLLKQYSLNPGGQGVVYEFFTIENGIIRDVERYDSSLPHSR